jgi:hypothetical protein
MVSSRNSHLVKLFLRISMYSTTGFIALRNQKEAR